MPYCQACAEARLMDHDGDVARCPTCGWADPWLRRPLFVVLGACGVGKTTITGPLAHALRGECAVFDSDLLIDPMRGEIATRGWFALFDGWLHVASAVAQSGQPTLVLGQLLDRNIDDLDSRRYVGDVHHLALDCPDDEIRRRLAARPAWRDLDVDGQLGYASWLRENIPTRISTFERSVDDVVDDLVRWVRRPRPG